jgi:hypothetical protein
MPCRHFITDFIFCEWCVLLLVLTDQLLIKCFNRLWDIYFFAPVKWEYVCGYREVLTKKIFNSKVSILLKFEFFVMVWIIMIVLHCIPNILRTERGLEMEAAGSSVTIWFNEIHLRVSSKQSKLTDSKMLLCFFYNSVTCLRVLRPRWM